MTGYGASRARDEHGASRAHDEHGASRAREEAERLVASVLAAATLAARRVGAPPAESAARAMGVPPELAGLVGRLLGPTIATGSPACCACPICRTIDALRDPDPDVAERLATGAGDIAAGVANLLRAFSAGREPSGGAESESSGGAESESSGGAGSESSGGADREPRSGAAPGPWTRDAHDDPWHAATTDDVPPYA